MCLHDNMMAMRTVSVTSSMLASLLDRRATHITSRYHFRLSNTVCIIGFTHHNLCYVFGSFMWNTPFILCERCVMNVWVLVSPARNQPPDRRWVLKMSFFLSFPCSNRKTMNFWRLLGISKKITEYVRFIYYCFLFLNFRFLCSSLTLSSTSVNVHVQHIILFVLLLHFFHCYCLLLMSS